MQTSHLKALKDKHSKLEREIHNEEVHASRNEVLIETLKKEKLFIKEQISRSEGKGSGS
jgi:hypothetical protein